MTKKVLKSNVFGRLTVVGLDHLGIRGLKYWKLSCSCGGTTIVSTSDLHTGKVNSCGCLQREKLAKRNTTHGMSKTRLYRIWQGVIRRCYNENATDYKNYGLRGITVCNGWFHSFPQFKVWADLNGYTDKLTIERIDNDKGYCPSNCTWIPKSEQSKNRRKTLTFRGRDSNGRFVRVIKKGQFND